MHILIAGISRFCAPSGLCRYTDMLGRSLSQLGNVQVSIALGSWQVGYFRDVFKSHHHSDIIIVDRKNNPIYRNAWSLSSLPGIARRLNADLVHLAYPMPVQRQAFQVPLVVTVHDLYPYDLPNNFSFPYANKLLFRWCISQSDAVVCVSRSTSKRLLEVIPKIEEGRLVTQIYNPVPNPELAPEQTTMAGCYSSRFILSVGQHRRNKNLHVLLGSYARLRSSGDTWNECPLVIVGSEGPETQALQALILTLGIEKHVLLLSSVSDSELAWLYHNCLLAVIPSSHEGLCMPLIEAVCSGARVVCSDIPVLRELGLPVTSYWDCQGGSAETLATAIAEAATTAKPTHAPLNPCDPHNVTRQFIALYRNLLLGGEASLRVSPV